MQKLQKVQASFRSILMILFMSVALSFSAQTLDHLLSPTFFDKFSSAQIVSDSIIRVFGLSYQRDEGIGGSSFFADYRLTSDSLNVSYQYIGENQCFFNYGITQLPILPLSDGGTIVGFNPFDCDYWPPGGLVKLNRDGSLDWVIDFRELDLWYIIDHIVFVDSNAIAVIETSNEDTLFINRSGELISHMSASNGYAITLETPFGFLAGAHDRLDVLNSGFEILSSYSIEDIIDIQLIGNDIYLIMTDTKYYHYDQEGLLMVWPLSPSEFESVWVSPKYFWGYSSLLNGVMQFDTLFGPLDTFSVARGFQPRVGIAKDSTLFMVGQYSNELNAGIVPIKYSENNPQFQFPRDIGVTQVDVADSILVDFVNAPFWGGGWYEHYDYINVEVTNFGNDTVHGYWIESKTTSACGFCYYLNPSWWIDTLPLPPGEKVWIALGAHLAECTWGTPVSICMTAYAPDHKADNDYENDSACDTYSFIVGTAELRAPMRISIHPNPAFDLVYIDISSLPPGANQISIFNMAGQKMDTFQMMSGGSRIPVEGYSSRIYLLHLMDSEGGYYIQRFVVQN